MKQVARFSVFLLVLLFAGITHAEILTYQEILTDTLAHAYQLSQARLDYEIKEKLADETQYDLWPELKLKFTSEYVENLANNSSITSVGGDVYNDRTTYQNAVYLDFTYTLIDYGENRKLLKIAKIDAQAAGFQIRKTQMELEVAVLDLYSDLLIHHKQKAHLVRSLSVAKQLLVVAGRSAKAGMADKLEITGRTIKVEEFNNKISQAEYEIANILVDLSFYTGRSYRAEPLKVSDLSFDAGSLRAMNFKRHPEYQYYMSQHKKVEEEYKIAKRQFFPKFDFYARYSFYGSDEDDYFRSYGEIRERSYSLGIYTSIPLNQNLKRRETLARIKMERKKTKVQMDGVLDSIRSECDKLSGQYAFFLKDIEQKKRMLELTRQKSVMLERLMRAKAIELEPALEQKLSLIDREMALERLIVERQVAIKHILIRVEGAV